MRSGGTIEGSFAPYPSLYADELLPVTTTPDDVAFYTDGIKTDNNVNAAIWRSLYFEIYECNAFLEGIEKSPDLSSVLKHQFSGEAKFLRAFAYFLLINTYGDVPLVLTSDVTVSGSLPRTSYTKVYEQIIADLTEATNEVQQDYLSGEKVRINKWAVEALLARVNLYLEKWEAAEEESTSVIASGLYTPLEAPPNVFLKNSAEAILQFYEKDGYTWSGSYFLPFFGTPTYAITQELLNSFSPDDLRRRQWIDSIEYNGNLYYYPSKYKNSAFTTTNDGEYTMCLRLAEQYLIRAEARCRQNKTTDALEDVNAIRERAGLNPLVMPISNDSCLTLILKERRKELFTEWGHRFFDLKRAGKIDEVLSAIKPTWTATAVLFPIPQTELNNNAQLTQNPGY